MAHAPGIARDQQDEDHAETHRQQGEIDKAKRHQQTSIPNIIDYANVRGLSAEVQQKLSDHRPETIGQAGRIPGVTPAAISLLMVHLKKAKS